ncbi:MAG: DUF3050 domain-containing protein [Opitutae bacterium]|nr:DUF3050 domain-containing protein [Opitutae bacterium]
MLHMNLTTVAPLSKKLESHQVFTNLNTLSELRLFMEHHVFAVWDFMSLLKKLQQIYVPHGSPWVPNPNGNVVRFINEIVMEEESDQSYGSKGESYSSHFEIYLEAMKEVGASTNIIDSFLDQVRSDGIEKALNFNLVPEPSKEFMGYTFDLINRGKGHEIAASFAIGRESIVPIMFKRILEKTNISAEEAPVFHYYLERHAHLDGEHHGPMALRLLDDLCTDNEQKEKEVILEVESSLEARIKLWDGVLSATQN